MKRDIDQRGLSALADLLIKVPSQLRESTRASTELLLERLGFKPEEHQYLFSTRFRDHIPALKSTPAAEKYRYCFELATGSAKEECNDSAWAEGYTSLAELMKFLGRTDVRVRQYLKIKGRSGWVYLAHRHTPNGLLRIFELGLPHELQPGELTLFEGLKQFPDPFASAKKRSHRSAY